MDTGIVKEHPYGYGRNEVEPRALFPELVHQKDEKYQNHCKSQKGQVDASTIEYGHDKYRDKVICDG